MTNAELYARASIFYTGDADVLAWIERRITGDSVVAMFEDSFVIYVNERYVDMRVRDLKQLAAMDFDPAAVM